MTKSMETKIHIFLIDPQTLVREGMRLLIASYPQFHVVGDTATWVDALPLVKQHQPQIILLEPNDGEVSHVECIPQLIKACEGTRLLLVTSDHTVDVNQAARLGAMGLVFKNQSSGTLSKAISKVYAGEAWFDRATIANMLTRLSQAHKKIDPEAERIASLSPREKEIIVLIGGGLKNQQIADKLALSENTVRHHLTSIFSKLGLTDRLELIIYAYQNNLARLPS